jgi:hypothetical protein
MKPILHKKPAYLKTNNSGMEGGHNTPQLPHISSPYFIYQGSIVTLAGSKILCRIYIVDSFKFYYCEKSENLNSWSLVY